MKARSRRFCIFVLLEWIGFLALAVAAYAKLLDLPSFHLALQSNWTIVPRFALLSMVVVVPLVELTPIYLRLHDSYAGWARIFAMGVLVLFRPSRASNGR